MLDHLVRLQCVDVGYRKRIRKVGRAQNVEPTLRGSPGFLLMPDRQSGNAAFTRLSVPLYYTLNQTAVTLPNDELCIEWTGLPDLSKPVLFTEKLRLLFRSGAR